MPTAYSYIRFSSPEQAKGDSLRRQIERSAEYARAHGLELDHSLRDLGVSGFKGANRHFGALARFLTLVEAAKIERGSYLLVESLDRLSREEVLKALQLFLAIIHGGITVVTLWGDARCVVGDAARPEVRDRSVDDGSGPAHTYRRTTDGRLI